MLQLNQNHNFFKINFIIIILLFSVILSAQDEIDNLLKSFKNGYKPVGQKSFLTMHKTEKEIVCYNKQNAHALILYNIVFQFSKAIFKEKLLKCPIDKGNLANPHHLDDLISCLDIYDSFCKKNNSNMYVQKLCNGEYTNFVPLHYAIECHKKPEYILFLIDHGADIQKLDPLGEYTALDIARRRIMNGNDNPPLKIPRQKKINAKNDNAINKKDDDIITFLLKNRVQAARIRTINYLIRDNKYLPCIKSDDLKAAKLQLKPLNARDKDEFPSKKARYE